jgi:naphthalene 1,2-dioxygenase ferredoxin reductase component
MKHISKVPLVDSAFTANMKVMDVLIEPLHKVIRVEPGTNLLEALRAEQVPMSYSCMAGRCGTCRCRVVAGEVLDQGRSEEAQLHADGQYVLACQTFLTEPCTIEIPEPDEIVVHPARIIKATVQAVETLTSDVKRLVLKPAKAIEFSPGQYAQLQFTSNHIRPYSMAGLATDDSLEFHVRVVAGGHVSGYVANSLKIGDTVRISGPLGTAYLRRKHSGPMLCVAGGTGLAPMLSILRGVVAAGMDNDVHVYVGARSPRDVYGIEWLRALQQRRSSIKLHLVVTSDADSRIHRSGLVTEAIEEDITSLAGWRAYLCGSPPMVEATTVLARRKGIESAHIYADAFYPQST